MKVFMKVTATIYVECSKDYAATLASKDPEIVATEVASKWFKNNRRVVTKAVASEVQAETFARACNTL